MVITWHNNTISSTSHVCDIRSDHITAYVHVCISWQCACCEGVCHSGRQSFSLLRSCCDTMHGAWLSVLFASPATRQGCDHFIHEPAEVVHSPSADHVLAHHQTCAEGVQHPVQIPAHQPTWWVECPCAHICNAMCMSTAVQRTCQPMHESRASCCTDSA